MFSCYSLLQVLLLSTVNMNFDSVVRPIFFTLTPVFVKLTNCKT